MGVDWVRFQLPTGCPGRQGRATNTDVERLRELAAYVSRFTDHGRFLLASSIPPEEDYSEARWSAAYEELKATLQFSSTGLDYWAMRHLLSPTVDNGTPPDIASFEACRVGVISHNSVFPLEWRDDALRTLLPDELSGQLQKWKGYIAQVQAGHWRGLLIDLYLFELLSHEHIWEQLDRLSHWAEQSLHLANAWCKKEKLFPIRDRILESDIRGQFKALAANKPIPAAEMYSPDHQPTTTQLEMVTTYQALEVEFASQIREWNRYVPSKCKIFFPRCYKLEQFVDQANDPWLHRFFRWCEVLIEQQCGLFLWA